LIFIVLKKIKWEVAGWALKRVDDKKEPFSGYFFAKIV
jgi:hypothetical protein